MSRVGMELAKTTRPQERRSKQGCLSVPEKANTHAHTHTLNCRPTTGFLSSQWWIRIRVEGSWYCMKLVGIRECGRGKSK